jgi:iodotyrosine deiodinase
MSVPTFLPLTTYREFSTQGMVSRARSFGDEMVRRRTVRQFSSRPIPQEVIEDCLSVARSAPSGPNKRPWHFVVVSNAEVKSKIRAAAEKEERLFYSGRAPKEWLDALAPLGTDENKLTDWAESDFANYLA